MLRLRDLRAESMESIVVATVVMKSYSASNRGRVPEYVGGGSRLCLEVGLEEKSQQDSKDMGISS